MSHSSKTPSGGTAKIEHVKKLYTFRFSISAHPPEGIFQTSPELLHLGNILKKKYIQTLKYGSLAYLSNKSSSLLTSAHF